MFPVRLVDIRRILLGDENGMSEIVKKSSQSH